MESVKDTGTKTKILDAAQELLQTRGANGISYQDISRAVKIRKASIHYHFPTKQKLIEEVVRRYCREFLDLVDGIVGSTDSPTVKLKRYIGLFESTLREGTGEKVCLCGMLGAELTSLGRRTAQQLQEFYRDNGLRLAKILREGRKSGALRFQGEPETLGMAVFSLLEGGMLVARADGGIKRFRQLSAQLLKLVGA